MLKCVQHLDKAPSTAVGKGDKLLQPITFVSITTCRILCLKDGHLAFPVIVGENYENS